MKRHVGKKKDYFLQREASFPSVKPAPGQNIREKEMP